MIRKNVDLRFAMISAGIRQYDVARRFPLSDTNFSTLINNEIPQEKRERILSIIEEIKAERSGVAK